MDFKMVVMDSFHSEKLGLVVTGKIESGIVKTGDLIKVVRGNSNYKSIVDLISYPGMKILDFANSESGYIGLSIKDLGKGEIKRGDLLCSVVCRQNL